MKKIAILEDDTSIALELKELLKNAGYQVLVITDYEKSVELILKEKVDLALLDINLPTANGEIILKELRKKTTMPIIMLTSRVTEVDEILSMSYGADDYITKPYNPTILLLRIQNVLKRTENTTSSLIYNNIIVNPSKGILQSETSELSLTKNEMIIFLYLLNNKGNIVKRDELMTDLWNNNEYINDNALTVNISRLRTKLEEFGLKDVIETRKGQGYKLL
ncbi:response regulator transcription factor [uncultured Psychrobacillus sp.]|uniref:response regulator transcription factor n=1 Tax=uncultured Psychrobacillus sp. TaxID=1551585 RepID=UPI00260F1C56|nr:response regulator transcription factor [uncultured Psychrobacillus sp.]